jgi:hypothetical protein
MWSCRRKAFGVAAVTAMIGCATGRAPRDDIAIIESGGVQLVSIDRVPLRGPPHGAYEIRPGGHTVDFTVTWSDRPMFAPPSLATAVMYPSRTERRSLCLKARGGRRYRIKTVRRDRQMDAFIVDLTTGEPPKTPCGPDEDDD